MKSRGGMLAVLALMAMLVGARGANVQYDTALTVAQCNCGKAFVELILQYGFGDALGDAFTGTLFVPNDAAMAKLPKYTPDRMRDLISYHIVPSVSGPLAYLIEQSPMATLFQPNTLSATCNPSMLYGCKNNPAIASGPFDVHKVASVVCLAEALIPCPPAPQASPCYQQTYQASPKCPPVTVPEPSPVQPTCPPIIQWKPPACSPPPAPVYTQTYTPSPVCTVPAGEVAISIWNLIQTDKRLTVLAQLIEFCGLKDRLATMQKATFFAPTNEAIANTLLWLGLTDYQAFTQPALMQAILAYHVLPGLMLWSDEIACGTPHYKTMLRETELTMHAGKNCKGTYTQADGTTFVVEGDQTVANVVQADIHGARVLVHVVDFILLPSLQEVADMIAKARTYSSPTGSNYPLYQAPSGGNYAPVPSGDGVYQPFLTLQDALNTIPQLSITKSLFGASQLLTAVAASTTDEYTYFLPTDTAWATLARVNPAMSASNLLAQGGQCGNTQVALLEKVLRLHIIAERVHVQDAQTIYTSALGQQDIISHTAGGDFYVSPAYSTAAKSKILNTNNAAGRSLYNLIDNVLITDFNVYYGYVQIQ